MVYNIPMFVQASDWTAEQWMTKISVTFPGWPAATCAYHKGGSQTSSYMQSPTYLSRLYDVCTVLLCSLAFCRIMYKEPQKQICWYYGFFQTRSFFLWVLSHQSRASHKWLGYEHILDQALWHLPINKKVLFFIQWKGKRVQGSY